MSGLIDGISIVGSALVVIISKPDGQNGFFALFVLFAVAVLISNGLFIYVVLKDRKRIDSA